MCIEDIEIWEEGKECKIYPSYVRFPECFDFDKGSFVKSGKAKSNFKEIIKNIDKSIKVIITSPEFKIENSKRYKYPHMNEFLEERKEALQKHLVELRKERNLRRT